MFRNFSKHPHLKKKKYKKIIQEIISEHQKNEHNKLENAKRTFV